ncbi:MAG: glycosyltransferase family 2 protein [Myxococcales bacterium]
MSAGPLLSATVIALDEEERLPGCLASLAFCDELLVVDGGSTDRTREVAAAAGARVLSRRFDDFARQHEFARTQARGDWILSIDADERASPALAAGARAAVLAGGQGPAAYALPFQNHFRGTWLRHGGLWPDRHVRLFHRDACSYDPARPVHERLRVDGRTAALDAPILHFTWGSLAQCLAKSERYAEAAAQALFAQGRRAGAPDLVVRPLWRFLRGYVLQLGFLDGAAGALVAAARAHEVYARYARLWELSRFPGAGADRLR